MKHLISLAVLALFFSLIAEGQIRSSDAINYSPAFQIDSSENYLLGSNINRTNKKMYASGYYFKQGSFWTNVFIYNSSLNQTHKVFTIDPILIYPVLYTNLDASYRSGNFSANVSLMLRNSILLLAKTDEYNKDGLIDDKDPVYLFMSSKSGSNLKQITPSDMTVTSYTLSKDGKILLVKLQGDKNGDKNFTDEDEVIYQFDLNDDFNKIKSHQIIL
jgi:hypothetical protein